MKTCVSSLVAKNIVQMCVRDGRGSQSVRSLDNSSRSLLLENTPFGNVRPLEVVCVEYDLTQPVQGVFCPYISDSLRSQLWLAALASRFVFQMSLEYRMKKTFRNDDHRHHSHHKPYGD